MDILLKNIFIFYRILLILSSIIISKENHNNHNLNFFIENYYSFYENKIINIELDRYISGSIKGDDIDYYKITLLKDSEQVIFDYQSKYGCLNVYLNKIEIINKTNYDFLLCSEGIDSIFNINKSEIIEKIGEKERDTLEKLKIIIGVGYPNSEINKINFKYSLKISLKKENISIYEINSEHKILCKTEKINNNKFKCLFVITYNSIDINANKDINLIIYPKTQTKNVKLNIYADFIDKEYYIDWNTEFLLENIPNNNSYYNNTYNEQDFVYILINDSNKYIYVCVESNNESTIEMIAQFTYKNEEIILPETNEMKIYTFYENYLSFNFNTLIKDDNFISISLGILNGKVSIYWEYDDSKKYIIDEKENLFLDLNYDSYNKYKDKFSLVINDLEFDDRENVHLRNIFYVSLIEHDNDNVFEEIEYGKSIKFSYENRVFPIMFFSPISDLNSQININLQIYEFSSLNFMK